MPAVSNNSSNKILLAVLLILPNITDAFVLNNAYWKSGEAELHIDFAASNPPGANAPNVVSGGPDTSALQTAYLEAADIWTNTSSFKYTTNTSAGFEDPCPAPTGTSKNSAIFASDNCGSAFGSATLAVQQTWSSGSDIIKTGTVFNNLKLWNLYSGSWLGSQADFKRVAVHELGHGLGLAHSADSAAIMFPTAGSIETPQNDDLAGAAAFYDQDNDNVGLSEDNCPNISNTNQTDTDNDAIGDACDADIDNDGVFNSEGIDASYGSETLTNGFYPFGPGSGSSVNFRAMTFPVNLNGSIEKIMLPIDCPAGTLTLSLQTLNASNRPSGTALTSQVYIAGVDVPTNDGGFIEFSFTTPTSVSSGTSYAIVAEASNECRWSSASDNYASGTGYISINGTSWFTTVDFPFSSIINPTIIDNCPLISNPSQADLDNDNQGDACDADDDNDGLSDEDEINIYNTDPTLADSDGDGLNDGDEVNTYLTDPNLEDTDNDGTNDGDEVANGSNPLVNEALLIPFLHSNYLLALALLLLIISRRKISQH